jgi:ubiquinol-cytochrome c reductase iron-sulfur subunit
VNGKKDIESVNSDKREFLTVVTTAVGLAGAGLVSVPFVKSLEPDAAVKAASVVTVDISQLKPGMHLTISWQDKPVIIVHRTPEMLATLKETIPELRDPDNHAPQQPPYCDNPYRSRKPEWLVMARVCTHLCCTPLFEPNKGSVAPGWLGGFHCPCHGSLYDLSGRVFKNVPAPRNMAIPEYEFTDDHKAVKITGMWPKAKLC